MAPSRAIQLLRDDWFFEMVDLRDHVGKRSNQQRRIVLELLALKENPKDDRTYTGSEISIYKSTVVLVGEGAVFQAQGKQSNTSSGSDMELFEVP